LNDDIFDLDYRWIPTVVSRKDYFQYMFRSSEQELLLLKVIPADEYLEEYKPGNNSSRNYIYYIYEAAERYRVQKP